VALGVKACAVILAYRSNARATFGNVNEEDGRYRAYARTWEGERERCASESESDERRTKG